MYLNAGFDVMTCNEGGERRLSHHIIQFEGDYPDEGFRAAKLAEQLGYPLIYLRRVWDFDMPAERDIPY